MFDDRDFDIGLFPGESPEDLYQLTLTEHDRWPTDDVHVLPDQLEEIAPGLYLAAILESVDSQILTGYDLVRYVQASDRLNSHERAGYYKAIGELAHSYDPDTNERHPVANEFASEELQAALAKTRRSSDLEIDLALDLRHRLPDVARALDTGEIDLARAKVFAQEASTLDPELISGVVGPILARAGGLTTGQLRARLQKAVVAADPQAAEGKYQAGVEGRQVNVYPNPDLTGTISITNIASNDALLASEHLHTLALGLKRLPGETRTLQQVMADLAVDLLKGQTITTPPLQPKLVIHVNPADPTIHVPGYGPVLPNTLSRLLEDAQNKTETLTTTSETSDCDEVTESRTPTAAQKRHIRSRYPVCIFMGCRRPAEKCDLDHRHPYSKGGKTTCHNLAPLCRHHHTCKTKTNWKLTRNPNGSHTWTSPLGHTYQTRAPP